MILHLFATEGRKWGKIAGLLKGRSSASVRNRYLRIEKGQQLRDAGKSKNRCAACGQHKLGHVCTVKNNMMTPLKEATPRDSYVEDVPSTVPIAPSVVAAIESPPLMLSSPDDAADARQYQGPETTPPQAPPQTGGCSPSTRRGLPALVVINLATTNQFAENSPRTGVVRPELTGVRPELTEMQA